MKPMLAGRKPMLFVAAAVAALACNPSSSGSPGPVTSAGQPPLASASASGAANAAMAKAAVGAAAPDFTLADLDGHPVTLSSFKGKTVVLEWFNPGCPFVRKAHTVGSLKDTPARAIGQGVVWLAVNSSAPSKEGAGADANRKVAAEYAMKYPVLLDEAGTVGHAYGATNTPNMFVIDPQGTLVYRGAIDNSPDAEGQSPTDGKLINYVDEALSALKAHQAVRVPETKAYGCSVKYASG
jgi:cytochrome oxidase Cu insertion factor (SCO1/SenC/PrrC family)